MGTQPILSVVVTVVSDTSQQADLRHLEFCLEALHQQVNAPPMEVLVTCEPGIEGLDILQRKFREVRFMCPEGSRKNHSRITREHHDVLRGIGLREARAPIVASLEDHDRADARWCSQVVKEHQQPYAAIGGAVENGVDRALNWAVYFCDFGRYQNPVPRGPAASLTDAHVSYKRSALESVASVWTDAYNEVTLHAAFKARGEVLYLTPDMVVYQHRLNLRLGTMLVERYVWGRSFGATRAASFWFVKRGVFAALCVLVPLLLLRKQAGNVLRTRRNRAAFLRALPLTALLDLVWAWGEFLGYVTGRAA